MAQMKRMFKKCFPFCVESALDGEAASSSDSKVGKQQPLSDFFAPEELLVLGSLASRVKVIIDDTLPATLHGTSRVTNGVPLAIVNHR